MKKLIKNYLAKLQENDKKGFSLVELIIVMAIMAILVGVVASQVIPYMEKSRQSKDQQYLSEVCTAMVSAIAQSPIQVEDIAETQLSSVTNNTGATGTDTTAIGDNLADLLQAGSTAADLGTIETNIQGKFASKAYKANSTIYVAYDATTGTTSIYVKDANGNVPTDGSKLLATSD